MSLKRYGACPHCNMGLIGRSAWCTHCQKKVVIVLSTPTWDDDNDYTDAPYDIREFYPRGIRTRIRSAVANLARLLRAAGTKGTS